mmetsp:Transcript_16135/g.34878  ORF Transcript_16135/g.34878 Transcript_16135/m.34878 type:complete len:239 (+) Transcript_16135:1089-1805(+)
MNQQTPLLLDLFYCDLHRLQDDTDHVVPFRVGYIAHPGARCRLVYALHCDSHSTPGIPHPMHILEATKNELDAVVALKSTSASLVHPSHALRAKVQHKETAAGIWRLTNLANGFEKSLIIWRTTTTDTIHRLRAAPDSSILKFCTGTPGQGWDSAMPSTLCNGRQILFINLLWQHQPFRIGAAEFVILIELLQLPWTSVVWSGRRMDIHTCILLHWVVVTEVSAWGCEALFCPGMCCV